MTCEYFYQFIFESKILVFANMTVLMYWYLKNWVFTGQTKGHRILETVIKCNFFSFLCNRFWLQLMLKISQPCSLLWTNCPNHWTDKSCTSQSFVDSNPSSATQNLFVGLHTHSLQSFVRKTHVFFHRGIIYCKVVML